MFLGLLAVSTSVAPSQPLVTNCDGSISGTPTQPLTIVGDVIVVPGAEFCELLFVSVTGNVENRGGTPLMIFGSSVAGNVQSEGAAFLELVGAVIGGNLTIKGTTGLPQHPPEPTNFLCNSQIGGNVKLDRNEAPFVVGAGPGCAPGPNTIAGNLDIHKNSAAMDVSGNTIGGNLNCHKNSPAVSGAPGSNSVAKNKLGECEGL
jgi:hypothetical protein